MTKTKSNKKVILAILAVIMICAVSISGTLAYLTQQAPVVSNAFTTVGGGVLIDPDNPIDPENPDLSKNGFVILEHKADKNASTGKYTLKIGDTAADLTKSNSYDVYQGVNIPKDPFVNIKGLTQNAFLYVEIQETTWGGALSYATTANWVELKNESGTGVTGPNGGKVYVYSNGNPTDTNLLTTDLSKLQILANNEIVVSNDAAPEGTDASAYYAGSLKFYGYLSQASGFATPYEAFNTNWGTSAP